ncbi:TetR/AcrR family transcriptional regulator [Actinoallomurus iriomotensis]|uniref:TetR family transcriptional regulator n=1 Tax=Actinoallomurus iriomotensis TaxID=478107 RepID=A0A9W6RK42_9ACTN|nr:TetR family transcriptional regulator [Actinoallomurus iriomotensis]GLY77239.1 TetR family transcriptional regulator [Actinoallomurus iriomotensis]
MGSSSESRARRWSPNQRAKQEQIIEAAKEVLARDGLAACTARAVADASPLTKSAIHYYFDDMDEIIDGAMARHMSGCLDRIRAAADEHERPVDRFWAAVRTYLEIFAERPNAALLWFSYWVDVGQKSRLEPIDRMHQAMIGVLRDLLADIPVDDPPGRAHALFSYLLGTLMQQAVRPLPFAELMPEIASVCRLDSAGSGEGRAAQVPPER